MKMLVFDIDLNYVCRLKVKLDERVSLCAGAFIHKDGRLYVSASTHLIETSCPASVPEIGYVMIFDETEKLEEMAHLGAHALINGVTEDRILFLMDVIPCIEEVKEYVMERLEFKERKIH